MAGFVTLAICGQIFRNWLMLQASGIHVSVFDATAVLIAVAVLGVLPVGPSVGAAAAVLILGAQGVAGVSAAGVMLTATAAAGALVYAAWAYADRRWGQPSGVPVTDSVVAAPGLSILPPKATAQAANQAQPSARPARTSVSQWTSSSTRLAATATAMPTARPATAGQRAPAPPAPGDERDGRPQRRRGRGVAAGERRPERLRHRVEVRADAIDERLEPVR